MKLRVALAAAAVMLAFAGTPTTAEAGGLHKLCPVHLMHRLMHHHHHAPAPKAAPVKKAAPKVAKAAKAAKKPLK